MPHQHETDFDKYPLLFTFLYLFNFVLSSLDYINFLFLKLSHIEAFQAAGFQKRRLCGVIRMISAATFRTSFTCFLRLHLSGWHGVSSRAWNEKNKIDHDTLPALMMSIFLFSSFLFGILYLCFPSFLSIISPIHACGRKCVFSSSLSFDVMM